MTVYGYVLPRTRSIAHSAFLAESLTERAKQRLKILDWHKAHGENVSLTARRFGLGRSTVTRWVKKMNRYGVIGLNDRSTRPKKTRVPTTPSCTVLRITELRNKYPCWSKYKISSLLKKEGITVSESTVGRVLKRRGLIDRKTSKRRRKAALSPKKRFPRGLKIASPGDLLQIDTKCIVLVGGKRFYQFTAIDVLTKLRVLRVYPSESSRNGAKFLREVLFSLPFKIKAVQTDNGSSFLKDFEKLCKDLNITHYFTHSYSPKENTYVERSHGSDEREFYRQGNVSCILPEMQKNIKVWENIWNNIRPHEALRYLTPYEYYLKLQKVKLPTKNVIILQT